MHKYMNQIIKFIFPFLLVIALLHINLAAEAEYVIPEEDEMAADQLQSDAVREEYLNKIHDFATAHGITDYSVRMKGEIAYIYHKDNLDNYKYHQLDLKHSTATVIDEGNHTKDKHNAHVAKSKEKSQSYGGLYTKTQVDNYKNFRALGLTADQYHSLIEFIHNKVGSQDQVGSLGIKVGYLVGIQKNTDGKIEVTITTTDAVVDHQNYKLYSTYHLKLSDRKIISDDYLFDPGAQIEYRHITSTSKGYKNIEGAFSKEKIDGHIKALASNNSYNAKKQIQKDFAEASINLLSEFGIKANRRIEALKTEYSGRLNSPDYEAALERLKGQLFQEFLKSESFKKEKAKLQERNKQIDQKRLEMLNPGARQNFFTRTWNKMKNIFGGGATKAPTSPQAAGKAAEENKP